VIERTSLSSARGKLLALSLLLLVLLPGRIPCHAQSRSVALTFDDLPAAQTKDPSEAELINRAILASLDRHHVPAIGFVIGKRAEEIGTARGMQLLRDWIQHGYDLGNHTYSHFDLDDISADQLGQDVTANEPFFLPLLPAAKRSPR
jgi:peptidoglycan/xylan/chitin deacetylase (PgdA/CDA1 family)